MQQTNKWVHWVLFIILCIIWGTSFILMKVGMNRLSAYQVAALRILSAGIVLLPVAIINIRKLPTTKIGYILLSGLLGNFFPAFLFCIAETKIDSSLAGILNALTPLFTIISGAILYKTKVPFIKIAGVIIGFTGLCLLFISRGNVQLNYIFYASLILIATIMYGVNANMVGMHLKQSGSLNIAAFAFSFLSIPAVLVLWYTGYFNVPLSNNAIIKSTIASCILGIAGTAVATILFYILLKRAGALFASMVTYGIPFVAIGWGVYYGELITIIQVGCLCVILAGVYITNNGKK
jgi:drug/metabolite transporter (DMT)-like permease